MNTPKISVIVPVYNVEKYLPRCIESILSQTFSDFELLLIDDGSTDTSGNICDAYAKTDSRIKVYHTENRGVSAARNLGIQEASADWICFVDSDDWVEEDYLKAFFYEKTIKDRSIVCQRICVKTSNVTKKDLILFSYDDIKRTISSSENLILCSEFLEKDVYVFAKLFRKDVLITHHVFFPENISICEDVVFLHSYLLYIEDVFLCSSAHYHHIERSFMSLSKKFHPSEEWVIASKEMLGTTKSLIEKFHILDGVSVRSLYTLYGLSSFYAAFINATEENYSFVFEELKAKGEYLKKYYMPTTLKQKVFKMVFYLKCFPNKLIFHALSLYKMCI